MGTVFYQSASELATLTNTFKVGGVATDPTTISLAITAPSGTTTTYTYAASQITRTSAGVYTKDIACSEAGIWQFVWTGTGAASDVEAGTWTVQTTELTKLYATVEELKSRFGGLSDTTDDLELRLAAEAISRGIDDHCNRHFWRGTATRTFEATSPYCVSVGDLVSVTTLKTDAAGDGTFETTWATTDYQLRPVNATTGAEAWPYTEIRAVGTQMFPTWRSALARDDRVQVVGVFGWPTLPAAVKQAALILAADVFQLKNAPFGMHSFGDFAMRVRDNPRAMMLLAPYRRSPVLVG